MLRYAFSLAMLGMALGVVSVLAQDQTRAYVVTFAEPGLLHNQQ